MFLSIFAATCRPNNITGFFDNLAETAADPGSFEVLVKVDEGADELIQIIENYRKTAKFSIKYLVLPKLDGYYSLDVGYNELLKIVHPDCYFCWLLTDEIRLETKGWDDILKKYIGFYPDDIFRIKLSIFQSKNYINFFECLPCPDNYAVTTRKWLDISGGWGQFWGPDSWHQCVDYYLGLCKNEYYPFGVWRSFPVFDIKIGGQEAGQGIENVKKLEERSYRIWFGWRKHSTFKAQENFFKLAQRLNLHIYATAINLKQYVLQEDLVLKRVGLYSADHQKAYLIHSYQLPHFKLVIGYKTLNFWHVVPFLYVRRRKIFNAIQNMLHLVMLSIHKIKRTFKWVLKFILTKSFYRSTFKFWRKEKKKLLSSFTVFMKRLKNTLKRRSKYKQGKVSYLYDGKKLTILSQHQIVMGL